MDAQTESCGWIDWDHSDDTVLVVCVAGRGTDLEYPFTVSEFWSTVEELDDEACGD